MPSPSRTPMPAHPLRFLVAQAALVVALALGGLGCGSARPPGPSGPGYSVGRQADGSVSIRVDEGASPETMTAALMAAAGMTAWEPPKTAPHLTQIDRTDLGTDGTGYRYRMDGLDGRFDAYVYQNSSTAEAQTAGTQRTLEDLVRQGRIESSSVVRPLEAQEVVWNGRSAALHRIVFAQQIGGEAAESYMYLIKDDLFWVKVRATFPVGETTVGAVDALVRGLLGA